MSTLLYESLTSTREATKAETDVHLDFVDPEDKPVSRSVSKLVDTVAALVPVEVLAAHAALLGAVSQSTDPAAAGPVQVTITDEVWATRFWWFLLGAAVALYAVPHLVKRAWDRWDFVRALIPAAAFAAWTMLQKATLFDAIVDWSNVTRIGFATFIALVALIASRSLAEEAERKNPST